MKQDIKVSFNSALKTRDISIGSDGDLGSVDDFSTSIDLSILTSKRAAGSEVPSALDRRGWIGDIAPRTPSFLVGSKVWLFQQQRHTQDTVNDLRDAVREAVQWYVDGGKAERVQVEAELLDGFGVQITVIFFIANNTGKRYFTLWNNTEEQVI